MAEDSYEEAAIAETKLKEAAAELSPEGGAAHADPVLLKNLIEGGADRAAIFCREVSEQPVPNRLVAI